MKKLFLLTAISCILILTGCAGAVDTTTPGSSSSTDRNWVQDAYLKASNAGAGDSFGYSVAVSGDIIVVGAYGEASTSTTIDNTDGSPTTDTDGAGNSGAVYVFKKDSSGNWVQDAYLKASNAGASDYFGSSVAISGEIIVVGAGGESNSSTTIVNTDNASITDAGTATWIGAAYVFKKDSSGNWVQDAYLKASNAGASDNFGSSVAVSGEIIVVGAYRENNSSTSIVNTDNASITDAGTASFIGAAYIFKKESSGNWVQDAYLKSSNAGASDYFGWPVAVSGEIIVVGAWCESNSSTTIVNTDNASITDAGTASGSGAVYVFKKDSSGNWVQDAYLKASNAGASDWFGYSVAVNGDIIVVGANGESNSSTTIVNTDNASITDAGTASVSGAAYVFKKDSYGDWVQDAYLKASNAGANYQFGCSVAVNENIIVVGAYKELSYDRIITNTDGAAGNNYYATDSGAAYVFKKNSSGDWIQDAHLKASNSVNNIYFGLSVAVSGDTIIVGAYAESTDQKGITNTDGTAACNNKASNSGAAYVFKR